MEAVQRGQSSFEILNSTIVCVAYERTVNNPVLLVFLNKSVSDTFILLRNLAKMKTEIVLKVYCIILSFRKVTTQTQYNSALAVKESQHETRLSKNSETLLNSSFETKKAENEISESAKNCITNLLQLKTKPFTTEECCLNKICLNNYILNKIIREHPHTKELTLKLCTDHFYLSKEKITGCCSGGKGPKRYENNRSLTSVTPNIENPVIANCSIGLKSPKLNNEIKHLKPDIKEDQTQSMDR